MVAFKKNRRLGEVAKVISGYAFKSSEFLEAGIPVIKIKNIKLGEVDILGTQFVSKEHLNVDEKYYVKAGDILISLTGSHINQPNSVVGRVALFPNGFGNALLNQRAGKIIPINDDCDTRFLYYQLYEKEMRNNIASFAHGAANQANVSPGQVEGLTIRIPPLVTQKKIAAILSAYDNLIENNLRRIKILEEMAQNLYREWFINFRFPGHEQTRFVDSPLGRIPEGWEVYRLGDIATIDKGLSYKGLFLTEEGDPMVNLKCIIPGGGYNRSGTKPYSGQYNAKQKVNSGDVVFANTDITQAGNVIGTPAIVPSEGFSKGGLASHHISIVRLGESCPFKKVFLYHLLLNSGFKDYAKSCASGTTVLGFRSSDALDYKFIMPPILLVENYELFVENIYYMYEILMDKNATLCQTRDLLLPKLISGEGDVTDLDIKIPEEVSA